MRTHLQVLRGERTLADAQEATGINKGALSRYENGKMLPSDADVEAMETFYGPVADWYPPKVLLALEFDEDTSYELRKRLWQAATPVRPSESLR